MDFRNNSIPLEKITSQDVNKTIQRSTAKAIAMHGLGIQLWIGEDTRDEKPVPASAPSSSTIQLMAGDANYEKVVSYISKNNESMTFEQILANLKKKYVITDMLIKKLNLVYDGEATK